MRLSRDKLAQAVETMPLDSILGQGASKGLTGKQRRFAREVAQGSTKAEAYRRSYNVGSKATLTSNPYHLAADSRIQAEIQALQLAEQAQALQTPAQLRALVIQTLVQTAIDPETKPAVRVQAAKVLGTVVEVGAFVHRVETRHISSSEEARAKVMAEIRALMLGTGEAEDIEAKTLLDELSADDDTPPEYEDTQVIDLYGDNLDEEPQSDEKDGSEPQNLGDIVGGVSTPPPPDRPAV
jgi:hypothetical protein